MENERRFRLIVDGFQAFVTLGSPAGDLEVVNRQVVEHSGGTFEASRDYQGCPPPWRHLDVCRDGYTARHMRNP